MPRRQDRSHRFARKAKKRQRRRAKVAKRTHRAAENGLERDSKRRHAIRRAEDRCECYFTMKDIRTLERIIAEGDSDHVFRFHERATANLVALRLATGKVIIAVVGKADGVIVSFLRTNQVVIPLALQRWWATPQSQPAATPRRSIDPRPES